VYVPLVVTAVSSGSMVMFNGVSATTFWLAVTSARNSANGSIMSRIALLKLQYYSLPAMVVLNCLYIARGEPLHMPSFALSILHPNDANLTIYG
jgi:hypothetical protein